MMADELVKQEIVWIDTNEALEAVCELWRDKTMLAVDTEFMRTRTYYPIAGLIQVNDGDKNYLIDPTTINDFYPLVEIFDDPAILIVLHSCSEDLEVFQHTFTCLPKSLFDTQVAAAIAGHPYSMGYANLVREVLHVELPKGETRSDWLQRPLSLSQMRYAAIDVEYLYRLAQHLIARLREHNRLAWALEDGQNLVTNFFINQDPDLSYLRFKSAWKLTPRQLLILQGLSRWREDLAQEYDIPRNRLIKENALFAIAQRAPTETEVLREFEGVTDRMVRNNGEKIICIIEHAKTVAEASLPAALPAPLNARERDILDILRGQTQLIANTLNMPTEVLIRKKEYEAMIVSARHQQLQLPGSLHGWRKEVIGEPLLTLLASI